jgi:methanethiol S-methyltransferase
MLLTGVFLTTFYFLHSLLADLKVKAFLSRFLPEAWYRSFYNLLALLLLVPVIISAYRSEKILLFEDMLILTLSGLFILFTGLIILLKSLKDYDISEFSIVPKLSEPQIIKLKTDGLNKLVRHPLYLGTLLIFWGSFLIFPYDLILMIALISTLYLIIGIRLEERKLIRFYGDDYIHYKKTTPGLMPGRELFRRE